MLNAIFTGHLCRVFFPHKNEILFGFLLVSEHRSSINAKWCDVNLEKQGMPVFPSPHKAVGRLGRSREQCGHGWETNFQPLYALYDLVSPELGAFRRGSEKALLLSPISLPSTIPYA